MKRHHSRKPIGPETKEKKWHVTPEQYVVFAAAKE
jgi:hypothetical protein